MENKYNLTIDSNKLSENWMVFHPTGIHMFTCGEKKAKWYLKNKLADITNPFEITLNFMPKHLDINLKDDFIKAPRNPICVVTGVNYNLQRHHIVPYCYRTFLPLEYKSRNHHDVVLINSREHAQYEVVANQFKDVLSLKYGVPTIRELGSEYNDKFKYIDNKYYKPINILRSIFNGHKVLTNKQKVEKLKELSDLINIDAELILTFNYIQLYKIFDELKLEHHREIEKMKNDYGNEYYHGYRIVEKLKTEEDIKEFIYLWRRHFITVMKPKYMPKGWNIYYRVKSTLK